jgi:hypothetical protein
MPILLAATGPWHLDWDALVAIATLMLAVATIVLALITKAVAAATRAEAESQNRPILLPVDIDAEGKARIRLGPEGIWLAIRNGGKGPAFAIRARLDPLGLAPEDWNRGILEQGQVAELRFRSVEPELLERFVLLLDYRDLAGKEAATRITIGLVALPKGEGDQRELIRDYAFVAVDPQAKHFGI